MDAVNSFYVKFIGNEAPTFFGYIISVLAMVYYQVHLIKINHNVFFLYCLYQTSRFLEKVSIKTKNPSQAPRSVQVLLKKQQIKMEIELFQKHIITFENFFLFWMPMNI